jgi:hypothetical protein
VAQVLEKWPCKGKSQGLNPSATKKKKERKKELAQEIIATSHFALKIHIFNYLNVIKKWEIFFHLFHLS